uniref:Nucleolar protein 8 n=1 Tax=Apteryx owenii TaxID=8824 RepID=A0A8B9QRV8_APTOW
MSVGFFFNVENTHFQSPCFTGVSILNKTKWKGGTLQIELAKESFLHRLAMEREEAKLQKEKPQRDDRRNLLESLEKAGVVDFHMKAVPGTEVPGHKNWVVGKFGRVLPNHVFYSLTENNIVKYDPSKYCHNLRKLEQDLIHVVPVSKLTWHLEGRDDSISKKRQGQFPVTKKPPKKQRQLGGEELNGTILLPSGCQSQSKNISSSQLIQRSKSKSIEMSKLFPSIRKTSGRDLLSDKSNVSRAISQKNIMSVSDSNSDSEEEIRAMIKKEMGIQKAETNVETESDHLEIVGDDFELKYNTHWSLDNPDTMKKVIKGSSREKESMECDNGYDSADTDEIIAVSKTPDLSKNIRREGKKRKSKIFALQSATVNSIDKTSDGESSYSESEEGESDTSSVYESMMQNCYRLDLTLDDLKALATENTEASVEDADNTQSSSECSVKENAKGNVTYNKKHSKIPPVRKKKCICPDDIVAALLEGEENDDEESTKGQNNSGLKYQPFRGMGSLCEKELTKDSTGLKKRSVGNLGFEACFSCCGEESSASKNTPLHSLQVSPEKKQHVGCDQLKELSDAAIVADKSDQPICRPHLREKSKCVNSQQEDRKSEGRDAIPSADESEDESSNMDSNALTSEEHIKGRLKSPKLLSKKLERDVKLCFLATASKEPDRKKKQLQDNQRRLAALEERQKERELQKKLIQGALSNLVITFFFFSEQCTVDKEKLESAPKPSGRLFESSEDEQDDTDDERFKIKPQFEGKAGEKLLHLQSRFGTDERFRLDARFLESDSEEEGKPTEEEELAAEKKKNLQILGNLLNINLEHSKPTKTAANAKKFKYESCIVRKEGILERLNFCQCYATEISVYKAKRKKKREESEKLPEVSKEIYYDIAMDLKELFGSSKSEAKKSEVIPWDKDDAEEATSPDHQTLGPNVGSNVAQESSGFTFSFFGDMDESTIKEEPYVLETIKPAKVAWQEDPRFQDSSSEDDEEPEASENERDKEIARFFFFSKDDERLRGITLFFSISLLKFNKDNKLPSY